MSGFRLIGIRTRDRINVDIDPSAKDYLKVLHENTFYPFYNSFKFDTENDKLIYDKQKDVDIYSLDIPGDKKDKFPVNLSAIVGENGSGKSTIIELLFLAIHNISSHCNVLKSPDDGHNAPLESGVKLDLLYQIENQLRLVRLDNLEIKQSSTELLLDQQEYSFDNFTDIAKIDLKDFFYSIAINYSIYSLNSIHVGDWIRALFHKNDAYQTPVVINPMRDRGDIKINREENLSKARLLSNLLIKSESDDHLKLTDNQSAEILQFQLNRKKIENLYENKRLASPIVWTFEKLYNDYSNESDFFKEIYEILVQKNRDEIDVPFQTEVEKYIVKKLFKIAWTYDTYKHYLDDLDGLINRLNPITYSVSGEIPQMKFYNLPDDETDSNKSFRHFLKTIKDDKSHITFKLNQAINYLIKNPLFEDDKIVWNEAQNSFFMKIPISKLSKRIDINNGAEIINFLPPSLFDVEIFMKDNTISNKRSKFGDLSSGEQQLIQSIQSVIYHVNNLNSVFENQNKEDVKYHYINIVLDEIELYFHPDFQRKFASTFLNSLTNAHLSNIKGINIIFSTHSPFILSDIPSSNILRLEKGKLPEDDFGATFGANIHDLLANEFFLKKGFIGEFARQKIIEFYDELILLKDSNEPISQETYESLKLKINIVGDVILRTRLTDLLNEIPLKTEDLELQLKQAEKMVVILKKKLNG